VTYTSDQADGLQQLANERDNAVEFAAQLREEMRRFADQLDHLPADRGDMARLAAHMRLIANAGPDDQPPACRVCGCTEDDPCAGGCTWIDDPAGMGELCSRCDGAVHRVTIDYLDTGDTEIVPLAAGRYLLLVTDPAHATVREDPDGATVAVINGLEPGR
jgi:hypothetical protein